MKKLISMTDFVLETHDEVSDSIDSESMMFNYANFLKQPLELWMFVPCDEDGEIIKLLQRGEASEHDRVINQDQYFDAKERCLFDGFKIMNKGNFYFIEKDNYSLFLRVLSKKSKKTVEDLLIFQDAILTPTALKQIK